jgi:uncharacterized protein YqeY
MIIQKLKEISLKLRKERSPLAASIQFAISEVENVGKNKGNRETTDDEAIRVIQKLLKTITENFNVTTNNDLKLRLAGETQILESVLPKMATKQELQNEILVLNDTNKGNIMKHIKNKFGARADMKLVNQLIGDLDETS